MSSKKISIIILIFIFNLTVNGRSFGFINHHDIENFSFFKKRFDIVLQQLESQYIYNKKIALNNQPESEYHQLFVAGLQHCLLHQKQEAIDCLEQSLKTHKGVFQKNDDEIFLTYFLLSNLYNKSTDLERIESLYEFVTDLFDGKAELLIEQALYYYSIEEYEKSYALIKQAFNINNPEQVYSYIMEEYYAFFRYAIASCLAFMFKEYEFGFFVTIRALQSCDNRHDYKILRNNLKIYFDYIKNDLTNPPFED